MIIHLAGSASHLKEDLPYLRAIAQTIYENGDILALNWFEPAYGKDIEGNTPNNWLTVLDKYIEAASKADLLILEGTQYRFGNGFFAAGATQTKKPVLFVSRNSLEGKSITGINNQYLTCHTYENESELIAIVDNFLKTNALDSQDQRFNFFIDRQIYNYLRDKSYASGKTKSEIIRELLDREITGGNA
jgi:hypothetical protein